MIYDAIVLTQPFARGLLLAPEGVGVPMVQSTFHSFLSLTRRYRAGTLYYPPKILCKVVDTISIPIFPK